MTTIDLRETMILQLGTGDDKPMVVTDLCLKMASWSAPIDMGCFVFLEGTEIVVKKTGHLIEIFHREIPKWQPIETAPTDGRRLWISDGNDVWDIIAHADGSHKTARMCKFWMNAVWPTPPTEDNV
jgi:hypothetical protein